MSELVARVKAAIDSVEAIRNEFGDWHDDTGGEARAAIKAVAEWSMSNYYAETSILRLWTEVLAQLEDKT